MVTNEIQEWEEEGYEPRSPLVLLPRAILWFPVMLACIIGVFYPFYRTGVLQQWLAPFTQSQKVAFSGNMTRQGYVALATNDALAAGIPPDLFVRQINQESGFNPSATSPAGAEGIAQLMPDTAAGLGIDPWNPEQSLQGAARLMASYNRTYGGDYAKALAAYNAGTGAVQNAENGCGMAWMNCLPGETQNYIRVIMGY